MDKQVPREATLQTYAYYLFTGPILGFILYKYFFINIICNSWLYENVFTKKWQLPLVLTIQIQRTQYAPSPPLKNKGIKHPKESMGFKI